ncbi:MAG TPA: DUF6644 family protein [Steroidobacteraceae bacterium]|nr:DUF6644 family protein [Steroidobacteraceae bacterium]
MNPPALIQAIGNSAAGEWMRSHLLAMPWVNAAHVLCISLVFGSILVVDLRLLGLFDRQRAVTRVSAEMLRLTWAAFVGAVLTGALYFAANATTYWFNTAFRFKLLAILLAGVNMLVFQSRTFRSVAAWDRHVPTPHAARLAGALSILLWTTVIVLGRVIGFTKGYDVPVPDDIDFDFSSG